MSAVPRCAALRVGCAIGLALAALAAAPWTADAQESRSDIESLVAGDSLRLRVRGGLPFDAHMRLMDRDTLVLVTRGLADDWRVAASDLETLHRYVDRTPREGFRYGAAIGMAIGMVAGAAVGALLHATDVIGGPDETLQGFVAGTMKLSAAGLGVGALAGGFIGGASPGMGWIGIQLPVPTR